MERASSLVCSIRCLVKCLQDHGIVGLNQLSIEPLIPVYPMLAKPTKSMEEVFAMTHRDFVVEFKYDGERMQWHKKGNQSTMFSRSLECSTNKFDNLNESLMECFSKHHSSDSETKALTVESIILDGEIVALDQETKSIKSFQTLSQRKRGAQVSIHYIVYDILYFNGTS